MFPSCATRSTRRRASLAFAAAAGALFALLAGIPLMRLSGLPAGIATFAVLGITNNVISYWDKIGPGVTALALVPESGIWTLAAGALIAIAVAFAYQASPWGRRLRATREDAAGRAGLGHQRAPRAPGRVRDQRCARRIRRWSARARAGLDHDRPGLPRAHLHDARDARRRWRVEPARRGRRSAPRSARSTRSSATPSRACTSSSASRCRRERDSSRSAR